MVAAVSPSMLLRRSVVRVVVVSRGPRTYQPWELKYQENSSASACVVDGNRLLTCAHVVAHALHVEVTKPGDARRYKARIVAVDHDSELALLSVDDEAFFEGTTAVTLGGLPQQHDPISVWGYPTGGSDISITSGVVSRIEVVAFYHSQRALIALQTDAEVAPGNSGGPVFAGDALVGIALQPAVEEPRKAHLIPVPVIEHFLRDLSDGHVAGVPELGVLWQKIESKSLQAFVGLAPDETGILVTHVVYGSSAQGVIEEGDVIMSMDDVPIAGDGTFLLRECQRMDFSVLVSRRQVGDSINVGVLRKGHRVVLPVVLRRHVALVRPVMPGESERYVVYAGLVFQPLTYNYLMIWEGRADHRLTHYFKHGLPSADRREIVVLSQVLAHDVNVGYHDVAMLVVSRVNGRAIGDLRDVPEALKHPLGEYHVVEVENQGRRAVGTRSEFGARMVIDARLAAEAHPEILLRNGIATDRSSDLSPPMSDIDA